MNNTTKTETKLILDIFNDIDDAFLNLSTIPSVIFSLINYLGVDKLELTEDEVRDVGIRHKEIYDVLTLTQRTIWALEEEKERIYEKYRKSSESTATPTETTK